MKSFQKLYLFVATCTFTFVGCGSPVSVAPVADTSNSSLPDQKMSSSATATEPAQSSIADSAIKAEFGTISQLPSSLEEPNSLEAVLSKPATPAQVQVAPSTANDAISVVNLLDE